MMGRGGKMENGQRACGMATMVSSSTWTTSMLITRGRGRGAEIEMAPHASPTGTYTARPRWASWFFTTPPKIDQAALLGRNA